MRKKLKENTAQLSLFETNEEPFPEPPVQAPSPLEFLRARFEHGPEMTPEEYKRWIKVLIHISLRRME